MADWVNSPNWKPACPGGGSSGFSVECPATGEAGHGKPTAQAEEVLGYLFAQEVGVAVPETVLGNFGGQTIAVSKSWGKVSTDVPKASAAAQSAESSEGLRKALREASGLLAYHTWLGTDDHKDQHLVVRPGAKENEYEVASIDFALGAFKCPESGGTVSPVGPAALVSNLDRQAIEKAVKQIEAITDERIAEIVASLPDAVLPATEKTRVSKGLAARKAQLRAALSAAGWL